jgi:hypothetical protein
MAMLAGSGAGEGVANRCWMVVDWLHKTSIYASGDCC